MDEGVLDDLRALGANAATIDAARKSMRPKDEELEIFEDNVKSVEVFQRMRTQWARSGMDGVLTGLRYEALPVVLRRCKVPDGEEFDRVFDDLQIMEDEALQARAEDK